MKTTSARNTGTGIGRALSVPALIKKQRIENLSKKVRKNKATDAEKLELIELKST